MTITYASYLKVDDLLALQCPLSDGPEHDETLFIIIHQVYELWFKQILHESDLLARALVSLDTPVALHTFKRILTILKTMVAQVDILETMTPVSFTSFRKRLETASGFQSSQFREFEFVLGLRRPGFINYHPEGSPGRTRLERRLGQPTLYEAFLNYLAGKGYAVPTEARWAPDGSLEPIPEVHAMLLQVYRSDPTTTQICERLVDLDEGIQEWRYRHVKMVERTIGSKQGTGGSSGAHYLRNTLFKPLFPDLWQIRSDL